MAPEIILQDPYDACVDWWALGVMVFTMLTGMLLEKYPQDRLGYKGGDYPWIRGHAFFHGFDWNRLEALELDRPP
ncbi:unnamed protein product [Porites lobata]|uniref:Protein kinase domain-containing protein n=1 Tax=Porites lobata TaxID=104759 RepID=A0ABN8S3A7_9CNID|nr:unnamed protein product [Porites lobata]